jgi:cobyrinic acid a,c-diamide synthase
MSPAHGPDPSPASLALLAGLSERRWGVQHFRAWARPSGSKLVGQLTGRPGRHLDAWLMPPNALRAVFLRGRGDAELAVVEGTLDEALPVADAGYVLPGLFDRPGPLGPIAEALDLPCVALVDCRGLSPTHLPYIPPEADGVLLDHLAHPGCFETLRTTIALLAGKPVLGAVEALPEVRAALAAIPPDGPVPAELVAPLAQSFLRFADFGAIRALAGSRPPLEPPDDDPLPSLERAIDGRAFRVAYALDDAFGAYFPDTLETLEALGAELVPFSPIRDGELPGGVDLVMIGCGGPDYYAEALAANVSMASSLRNHVCRRHRIYSEGGGTAYLGRSMILADGRAFPGAGILPFDAQLVPNPAGPTPVERRLAVDGWLGPRGTTVRGYRSDRWVLHPAPEPDDCPARSGPLTHERDIYFRKNAVGSLIHLHLGALPQALAAFAGVSGATLARGGRA